jgi:hypothetical protein
LACILKTHILLWLSAENLTVRSDSGGTWRCHNTIYLRSLILRPRGDCVITTRRQHSRHPRWWSPRIDMMIRSIWGIWRVHLLAKALQASALFADCDRWSSRRPGHRGCVAVPPVSTRLIAIVRILLLMPGFLFLSLHVSSLFLCWVIVALCTSASAFHSFLDSGRRDCHCSPIIFDISGFGSPGCCATTAAC